MLLDLERQRLVLAWLSARAPNRRCSLCGGGDFAIGPELMVALPLSRPPEAGEQRGSGTATQHDLPPTPPAKGALDQDAARSLDRMEADVSELKAELQRLREMLSQKSAR